MKEYALSNKRGEGRGEEGTGEAEVKIMYFIEMPNDICVGPFETANRAAAWISAQQPDRYMRQNGGWRIKPLCDPEDPDWKVTLG